MAFSLIGEETCFRPLCVKKWTVGSAAVVLVFLMLAVNVQGDCWEGYLPVAPTYPGQEVTAYTPVYYNGVEFGEIALVADLASIEPPSPAHEEAYEMTLHNTLAVDTLTNLGYNQYSMSAYSESVWWNPIATQLTVLPEYDEMLYRIPLPSGWCFHYFGQYYNEVFLSSNGFLMLGHNVPKQEGLPSGTWGECWTQDMAWTRPLLGWGFPDQDEADGIIAPFMADLDPTYSPSGSGPDDNTIRVGEWYIANQGTLFWFCWNKVYSMDFRDAPQNPQSFAVGFFIGEGDSTNQGGRIDFLYQSVNMANCWSAGFEDPSGVFGVTFYDEWMYEQPVRLEYKEWTNNWWSIYGVRWEAYKSAAGGYGDSRASLLYQGEDGCWEPASLGMAIKDANLDEVLADQAWYHFKARTVRFLMDAFTPSPEDPLLESLGVVSPYLQFVVEVGYTGWRCYQYWQDVQDIVNHYRLAAEAPDSDHVSDTTDSNPRVVCSTLGYDVVAMSDFQNSLAFLAPLATWQLLTFGDDAALRSTSHSVFLEAVCTFENKVTGARVEYVRSPSAEVKFNPGHSPSPTAVIQSVDEATVGYVTFDGTQSSDPDPVEWAGLSYDWTMTYTDNTDIRVIGEGAVFEALLYLEGSWNVALTVTDPYGEIGTASKVVQIIGIPNESPTAVIGGDSSAYAGYPLNLDGSQSFDSDGIVIAYLWNFGDGGTGAGVSVSHVYATSGPYVVTLTVTDEDGATDCCQKTVTILSTIPTAVISGPSSGLIGESMAYSGSGSSDPDGAIVSYFWDFGDGATASGVLVSHSWTDSGSYLVTLEVTDDRGESDTEQKAVTVMGPPGAPVNLAAISSDVGAVSLSWDAPLSNGESQISRYRVYRGFTPGGEVYLASVYASYGYVNPPTSYLDQGLENGIAVYYVVTAVNDVGEGPCSNEASAVTWTEPSAPQSLDVTGTIGAVDLSWSIPSDNGGLAVSEYRIYRGLSLGSETYYASVDGAILSYSDTGVANWNYYFYFVTAINAVGESPPSWTESATPLSVPGAPELTASATFEYGSVDLTWTFDPTLDGGSDVTVWTVYRGTAPGEETLLYSGTFKNLRYLDVEVVVGTTYYYRVSGTNSMGEGLLSNEVFAMPVGAPSAPQNVAADAEYFEGNPDPNEGSWAMHVWWSPPATDGGSPITDYKVYRGTISGGEIYLATVGNVLYYQDLYVSEGVRYFYKVSAVNEFGESLLSSEASDLTANPPGPPIGVQAVGGLGQITLTWLQPISDGGSLITAYDVFRGTTSGGETFLASVDSSIRTYLDSAVAVGTTYYYKVRAVNDVGPGSFSLEVSAVPVNVPSAPQNLVATAGALKVVLVWAVPSSDGGAAITSYKIYRGTSSNGETYLAEVAGSELTYTDTGLTAGTRYFYKVTAVNSEGESGYSNEAYAVPYPPTLPGAPQSLAASSVMGGISLTWQAPASDGGAPITSYKIYRGTRSNSLSYYASVEGSLLTYLDTAVTLSKKYYYQVSAVNVVGEGSRSSVVSCVYIGGPPTLPTAPQNLVAMPGNGQVTLTWSAPSSDGGSPITAYYIYRGLSSGSETYLTQVSGSTLAYTNTGLTNGVAYYYRVTAVNSVGEGPASNEVSATPSSATKPTAPLSLVATPSGTGIHLTWNPPSSDGGSPITAYKIYRSTKSGAEVYYATVYGSVTYFDDNSVLKSKRYYYKVSAVNAVGESPLSNEASAVWPGPLAAADLYCLSMAPGLDAQTMLYESTQIVATLEFDEASVGILEVRTEIV